MGVQVPWADSHCHIPYEGVGTEVIGEAYRAGVHRMVSVGTDLEQSRAAIAVAADHEQVWATVGLHPHEASSGTGPVAALLEASMEAGGDHRKVVAVGECGLDYYYDHSPRELQRQAFAEQVSLARRHRLALVIHTRQAWDDTFDILEGEGVPERTVFHCFSGGRSEACRALDAGAWLSFSGIVTFPKASQVREAALATPMDRLLVETDSPYLAPLPHRGRPNRPALVTVVGAAVAALRGVEVDSVEQATWVNTATVFGLPA